MVGKHSHNSEIRQSPAVQLHGVPECLIFLLTGINVIVASSL
jgi:hypothetical protein